MKKLIVICDQCCLIALLRCHLNILILILILSRDSKDDSWITRCIISRLVVARNEVFSFSSLAKMEKLRRRRSLYEIIVVFVPPSRIIASIIYKISPWQIKAIPLAFVPHDAILLLFRFWEIFRFLFHARPVPPFVARLPIKPNPITMKRGVRSSVIPR